MDVDDLRSPGVFVLAPDELRGVGGIAFQYRFVEHLRAQGDNAWIMHFAPGFRYLDASPSTPVTSIASRPLTSRDVLVLPEIYGPDAHEIAPGVPYVILNQNAYYTFDGWGLEPDLAPRPAHAYRNDYLLGAICVSEQNLNYLKFAFPGLHTERVWLGFDFPESVEPMSERRRSLAYMPRKNEAVARQVLNMLSNRGALDGVEVRRLDGLSHAEVLDQFGEVQIFLSFASQEGFSVPLIEAMGYGALVIGFDGSGGSELLNDATGFPVRFGDVLSFATQVEHVLSQVGSATPQLQAIAEAGRHAVRSRHSRAIERASVQRAWSRMTERLHDGEAGQSLSLILPFDQRAEDLDRLSREVADARQEARDLREEVVETHARLFDALQQVEDLQRRIKVLDDRESSAAVERTRLEGQVEAASADLAAIQTSTTFRWSRRLAKLVTLNGLISR